MASQSHSQPYLILIPSTIPILPLSPEPPVVLLIHTSSVVQLKQSSKPNSCNRRIMRPCITVKCSRWQITEQETLKFSQLRPLNSHKCRMCAGCNATERLKTEIALSIPKRPPIQSSSPMVKKNQQARLQSNPCPTSLQQLIKLGHDNRKNSHPSMNRSSPS